MRLCLRLGVFTMHFTSICRKKMSNDGFQCCGVVVDSAVPMCSSCTEELKRLAQRIRIAVGGEWSVELIYDREAWLLAFVAVSSPANAQDVMCAIRCRRGNVETWSFVDRVAFLATAPARKKSRQSPTATLKPARQRRRISYAALDRHDVVGAYRIGCSD